MTDVCIVGLGITPFGRHERSTGLDLAARATRLALADAGLHWTDVRAAAGGSMSAGGADTVVSQLGLTGIPFLNVFNGCATGGSALTAASALIESERADIAVAVGFDKHSRGAFRLKAADWGLGDWYEDAGMMVAPQFFAMRIQRYMHDHGITHSTLTAVAAKAFRNGALNPNAWRREPLGEEVINGSRMVCDPLRQHMFCSPAAGAVALVLASRARARQLTTSPVQLRGVASRTRRFGSFDAFSPAVPVRTSTSVTADAASVAFGESGVAPDEISVAQVQDTDAGAEIIHMAEAGLCADGEQEKLIHAGDTEIGGRLPINTDGGCIANGEPVGASGLRQVHEVALQLRGSAGSRQVPGRPVTGFTHVYGAPGVSACAVLVR